MMNDPISDAELDAILNRNRANGSVSMLRPLEIPLERDMLLQVTQNSLTAMQAEIPPADQTPKQARARQRAIQQRIDFTSWLRSQDDIVHIALYPLQDELFDEDVRDVLDDEDLWPFRPADDHK